MFRKHKISENNFSRAGNHLECMAHVLKLSAKHILADYKPFNYVTATSKWENNAAKDTIQQVSVEYHIWSKKSICRNYGAILQSMNFYVEYRRLLEAALNLRLQTQEMDRLQNINIREQFNISQKIQLIVLGWKIWYSSLNFFKFA